MKKSFALLVGIALSLRLLGQEVVTMEQYLGTALHDQSLERYQAQLNFLDKNNYNAPWLNRVEVRVGTEEANMSLTEYRLRVSPSNPAEIKANKVYYNQHIKSIGIQYRVALNEALKNRYQLLIDYNHFSHAIHRSEQNLNILNSLMKNIGVIGLESIDVGSIVTIQSDQTELMLKLEELKAQQSEIEYYIRLDLPDGSLAGTVSSKQITVDEIQLFLNNQEVEAEWTSLHVLAAEEKVQLKEQMLKIDKTESRSNIGYIQGNFDAERGNELEEHIGFQVGLRIPIVNPDKPDLNRKKVEMIEDQKELDATKNFVNQKKEMTVIRLNNRINQYRLLNARIDLASKLSLSGAEGVNLSDVTKVKKYQFDLERDKAALEREIRELYIQYLDVKGLLVAEPLTNYLSKDFQGIE